jgi:hypothetical protein
MNRVRSPEHREQLKKLAGMANFMEDLPRDKCTMGDWSAPDHTATSCGSAGCLAGWAATVHKTEWEFSPGGFPRLRGPAFRHGVVARSFAEFFGVTTYEADALTCGEGCPEAGLECEDLEQMTPRDVARRIRAVVASYDPSLLDEQPSRPLAATAREGE